MSNLRIGYLNRFDSATLTVSPSLASGSLATYLQNDARGDVLLAAAAGSQVINATWGGTGYTLGQIALWRHNLLYSDTIRLQLYSDAAWTTQVYDSTALAAGVTGIMDAEGWVKFTNRYFTPQTNVKSAKITVSATSALSLSRVFLGPYTEAPINPQEGFQVGIGTNSRQGRGEAASLRTVVKGKWRTAAFDMMVKTEADRAAWFDVGNHCGIDYPFVVAANPGAGGTIERDTTYFAKFDGQSPTQKLYQNKHDFSMKIAEI